MDILYLLIPISLVLLAGIVAAFLWAVNSGQFDDLEGEGVRILMDREEGAAAQSNDDMTERGREDDAVDAREGARRTVR